MREGSGRANARYTTGSQETCVGADYTPDELEVLKAVDAYRRRTGKKFPTVTEIMTVMAGLGWRPPVKTAPPGATPGAGGTCAGNCNGA